MGKLATKIRRFQRKFFFTLDRALGTTESESNSKDIFYFKNEKFTQQDYMISLKRAAERLRIIQQSRYYAFSLRIISMTRHMFQILQLFYSVTSI